MKDNTDNDTHAEAHTSTASHRAQGDNRQKTTAKARAEMRPATHTNAPVERSENEPTQIANLIVLWPPFSLGEVKTHGQRNHCVPRLSGYPEEGTKNAAEKALQSLFFQLAVKYSRKRKFQRNTEVTHAHPHHFAKRLLSQFSAQQQITVTPYERTTKRAGTF